MTVTLKAGLRLYSAVDSTELIVVKAPAAEAAVTIGGVAAVADPNERTEGGAVVPGHDGGTAVGKRYVNGDGTVEMLCTKAGQGAPAVDGELLAIKEAKPLPASD